MSGFAGSILGKFVFAQFRGIVHGEEVTSHTTRILALGRAYALFEAPLKRRGGFFLTRINADFVRNNENSLI